MTPLRSRDDFLAGIKAAAKLDGFTREDLAEYLNVDIRTFSPGLKCRSDKAHYRFGWDRLLAWANALGLEIRFEVVRVREVRRPKAYMEHSQVQTELHR